MASLSLRNVPCVDEQLAEPVVLLGGAVAPVHRLGLGQLGDLIDPGDELLVLGGDGDLGHDGDGLLRG